MAFHKIESCRNCVPPERKPGCHTTCDKYIREKAMVDQEKEAIRRGKEEHENYMSYRMSANERMKRSRPGKLSVVKNYYNKKRDNDG